MQSVTINIRQSGGGYVARASGYNLTCSSTEGALAAVQGCALKCKSFPTKLPESIRYQLQSKWEFQGITLKDITPNTCIAAWEE
jgi:hypothetical protein